MLSFVKINILINRLRYNNIKENEKMIKDELINSETYYGLSAGIKKGFEWLKNTNLDNISDGRYEIDGNKIYANVQTYETKDDAKYEAHRNYIDIQYIVEGSERIGVAHYRDCTVCIEYDKEKDIEFLDYKNNDEWQKLNKGEFLVLFPHDAHKPSINIDKKEHVKKVVVKVSIT